VEYPTPTIVDDPFNFASILANTGKKFTKLEYADLFADDCAYIDVNGNTFGKEDIRNHLVAVQRELTIDAATWKKDTANPDNLFILDTILVNRTYDVSAQNPLHQTYEFADKASFTLVFNSTKNAWTITEWKDKYSGYSIFHPWFSPN